MADLKETDVEKAGPSSAQRRRSALGLDGSRPAKRSSGLRGFDGVKRWKASGNRVPLHERISARDLKSGKGAGRLRTAGRANQEHGAWLARHGRVRKSSDPIETLYAEIEKARGLLPKGGSRLNAFVAHRRAGAAKDRASEHWNDAFNDGSRGSYSLRVPQKTRLATQRKLNDVADRKKSVARYLSSRAKRK